MSTAREPAASTGSPRSRVGLVFAATAVAGAIGYAIQWVAGAGLPASQYAGFIVFWAALYLVVGGVAGIQQEVSRAVRVAGPDAPPSPRGRLVAFTAVSAFAVAIVLSASAPLWAGAVFPDAALANAVPLIIGGTTYVGLAVFSGLLYGRHAWGVLAAVIIADPLLRLLGIVISLAVPGVDWLDWGIVLPIPATLVIGLAAYLVLRRKPTAVDVGVRRLLINAARTVIGATATAVLISALPLFIAATSLGEPADELGALLFTLTVTRAPLVIPVLAFQSLLVLYFRDRSRTFVRPLLLILGGIAAGTLTLATLAGLFAPQLIGAIFGQEYVIDRWVLTWLVATAGLTAALCATGPVAIALKGHTAYVVGWVVAAGVAIGVLALPLDLDARTLLSLTLGPLAGLTVHGVFLARASRRIERGETSGTTPSGRRPPQRENA